MAGARLGSGWGGRWGYGLGDGELRLRDRSPILIGKNVEGGDMGDWDGTIIDCEIRHKVKWIKVLVRPRFG